MKMTAAAVGEKYRSNPAGMTEGGGGRQRKTLEMFSGSGPKSLHICVWMCMCLELLFVWVRKVVIFVGRTLSVPGEWSNKRNRIKIVVIYLMSIRLDYQLSLLLTFSFIIYSYVTWYKMDSVSYKLQMVSWSLFFFFFFKFKSRGIFSFFLGGGGAKF